VVIAPHDKFARIQGVLMTASPRSNRTPIRKAVFPVGGLGTRFLPATKAMPKEMLTVVDKPLIHYAVDEARASGIEEFIFVTGRGKTAIEDYFDENYELQSLLQRRGQVQVWEELRASLPDAGQVIYTRQPEPLGLGHAIWCARHIVGDEPFAVILADILIQSEKPALQYLTDHYRRSAAEMVIGTMTIDPGQSKKYGIVGGVAKDGVTAVQQLIEKPDPKSAPSQQAIIGRYILPPGIFAELGRAQTGLGGEIQLTDAMARLLPDTKTDGIVISGLHHDCGNKIGWLQANLSYALAHPDLRAETLQILAQHQAKAA
jgi:UTP--glucose-1-phosphate uridylyltransferase